MEVARPLWVFKRIYSLVCSGTVVLRLKKNPKKVKQKNTQTKLFPKKNF